MLEVVGVTGVVHLGQIQSGLRSAMRIAQVRQFNLHILHHTINQQTSVCRVDTSRFISIRIFLCRLMANLGSKVLAML